MGVKSFYRRMDLINKNNKLNLLNQKDQILLSFSGGQDSICLLFMLNQLYSQFELHITLFWCHHLWQTDSFYLMQQIAKLSFLFQFNSCFAIPSNSLSSELLARKWRQSCSYRVSLFYNNSKICLAHTFNDKVETIFFNFMRGTGLTKLSPLRREQLIYKSSSTNEKHVFRHQYIYLKPNILLSLTPSLLHTTLKGTAKPSYPKQSSPAHLKNKIITEQVVRKCILLCYAKNCNDFDPSLLLQICDFAMQNLNLYNKPKELFLLQSQALLTSYDVSFFETHCETTSLTSCSCETAPSETKDGMLVLTPYSKKGGPISAKQKAELYTFPYQNKAHCFEFAKNNSYLLQKINCNKPSIKETRYSAIKYPTPLPVRSAALLRSKATQALRMLIQQDRSSEGRAGSLSIRLCLTSYCKGSKKEVRVFLASQRTRSKKKPIAFTFTNCFACPKGELAPYQILSLRSYSDVSVKQERVASSLSKGTAGIKTEKGIARPLLSISRFEINKICFFWKLPIYPDTSNQKVKFLRNRVRRQLSPTIKFFFNSKIENIFLQLAEIVETEDYRFTQIINEFTKNIDVYDAKLQTHPTFTLLDKKKKKSSSSFIHPIKKNSIRSANFNAVNNLSVSSYSANISSFGREADVNFASPGGACSLSKPIDSVRKLDNSLAKMNLREACEIEKSMVCVQRGGRTKFSFAKELPINPIGISNAKPTASKMDEFKHLKVLDLLIQLIEINRFSHNVSLFTKLIDKIASQKNALRDPKLNKMSGYCFFEIYHLTNLDIKKLKKKFAKEPTKIINENILAITPPSTCEAKNMSQFLCAKLTPS